MTPTGRAFQTKVASVLVICAVSACGDDGSQSGISIADNAAAAPLIPLVSSGAAMSFADVQTWDNAISPIANSLFANNPVTPWADVPTTGSADVFVGGIELVPDANPDDRVFGTMNATTNFATGDITGEAQNFYSGAGTAQTGTLQFDAIFDRTNDLDTEFGIGGTLTGTLTGDIIDGPVDVDIAGDFADSATVMYGGGSGTAAGAGDVNAAFVLSQD